MSQPYVPRHQTTLSTSKINLEDEEPLHNIPSTFDLALNGGTNQTYLTTPSSKAAEATLLDPSAFRRLSISTNSSFRDRSISPYPHPHSSHPFIPKTWRTSLHAFWVQNSGLFLVAFSQLFGALMNVTTRLLELEGDGMSPFQILFARQAITVVLCTAWMWWAKVPDFPLGYRGYRGLLVVRSVSGFFGIFGIYYSLQYLPVADAIVITFLAPSVASYGCYLFLREPFPRSAQYASLISLLGVVLIARPTSFFASDIPSTISPPGNSTIITDPTDPANFHVPTSAERLSAILVALLGVVGSAGAFTAIRWIGTNAHPLISVNYFSLFSALISLLALTLSKPLHLSSTLAFALPSGTRQWSMLLFLGGCGFITQFLLTKGLATGGKKDGGRATNMIYCNMLFALALDKLVFGVAPGWWSLGGSGLILGSAVFVARGRKGDEAGEGGRAGREREGGVREEEIGMLGAVERDEERGGREGETEVGADDLNNLYPRRQP